MNLRRELAKLVALIRRRKPVDDLAEEIRSHLAMEEQENLESGMPPEEAHYAALRRFGNVTLAQERSREMWGWNWAETLWQDVRFGLRQLRKNPGFTAMVVITLALGIGANTAIFTLVDAVMLKSLPVSNPKQLYRLGDGDNCCVIGQLQDNWGIYSNSLYQQFRDHTPEFSQLAAFQADLSSLSARRMGLAAPARPYGGEFVSGNYFTTFGLSAFAGRLIAPADDTPGAPPVAVMSYRTWQQDYGLDPSVIGASFTINTMPYTIAGIAPPGFFGDQLRPDPPDFWLPLATEPALNGQNSLLNGNLYWLYIIGCLKPGANPSSVQSEATVELRRLLSDRRDLGAHERAELSHQHILLAPGGSGVTNLQSGSDPGLRLLMTISTLVLLIACANIANLLLARGATTRAETAIRMALGAPRVRLIRQIITESVLLAVLGGLAGLFVAFEGTRVILALAFRGAHYVPIHATPSLAVLGFASLLSLLTGIVFGIMPAWITSRSDPADALRGAGRSTRDRSSLPRRALVVVQVALSAVLLIGAGLLAQSLRNLEDQKFGFEPQGRLIVRVNPALAGYTPEKLFGLYQQLQQRLPQIPGVRSAAYSLYSPMRGDNWALDIHVEGHPPDEELNSSFDRVSPHYFETIGTGLLRGRVIGDQDTPTSRAVAVVNQTFVHKFFPKEDPIGKHFGLQQSSNSTDYEIVGVVEDAKYENARMPAYPTFFLPFLQSAKGEPPFMVSSQYVGDIELRVAGKPENLEVAVRRTLADLDPNFTVIDMVSLTEQVSRNFNQDRLIARLTELFGALALILACVGLYGVTAYSVARRTREFGIRMALGASRGNVLALVLRGALLQLVVGLAVGIPVALGGGRVLANQLYGLKSYDPLILGGAACVLTACALVAGFVPARRATKVDPMVALRYE